MKIHNKRKNTKQTNYIKNQNNMINAGEFNLELKDAFWFGMTVGTLTGLFFASWLLSNNKLGKKENQPS